MNILPDPLKDLRACFFCSLIKTRIQFITNGCENCPCFNFDEERVDDYTTPNFSGMIGVMDPQNSWVAKWQSINKKRFCRGIYAINVFGKPYQEAIEIYKENGYRYVNRDQTEPITALPGGSSNQLIGTRISDDDDDDFDDL
eukprot:TRINITY_DN537_c1_g5_i1.p1 TRINITY_DN537_c1_g5~~TRINITY_DN537_c1_g5_i1.p1  ORF type:complete len:142 (+),score=46.72 TRINITY_DN537_c1_g5_i1:125-550(+)